MSEYISNCCNAPNEVAPEMSSLCPVCKEHCAWLKVEDGCDICICDICGEIDCVCHIDNMG